MSYLRILCLCSLVLISINATAQKSPFKKADKFYVAKSYSKAIPLYEEALVKKESLSAKNKLANCYRYTNQTTKARELYADIVTYERANPKAFFYYGESLMQVGQYDQAREWFLKYAAAKPDDEKGARMAAACERVKLIRPVFPNAKITFFPENSESDDTAPVFYKNGIVFSTDRESGIKALSGKSDWTGRGNVHLYFSEEIEDLVYTKPSNFSGKLNAAKKNTGTASFTADEKEVFFARNAWQANKKGLFTMQLFSSSANESGKWKDVEPLNFCSIKFNYMHPSVSHDGKMLFFISDKPGGSGGMDIYVSRKVGRGWKRPQNLGENVNTDGHEGFPFYFADGRLYFCSKGHEGFGGFDIFYTEQDTLGVWQKPVNLGQPINSPFDDVSFHLKPDATKGAFTSGREGGDDDIYLLELSDISTDQLVNRVHMAEAMKQYVESSEQPAMKNEQLAMSNEQPVDKEQSTMSSEQKTTDSPNAKTKIEPIVKKESLKSDGGNIVQTEPVPATKNSDTKEKKEAIAIVDGVTLKMEEEHGDPTTSNQQLKISKEQSATKKEQVTKPNITSKETKELSKAKTTEKIASSATPAQRPTQQTLSKPHRVQPLVQGKKEKRKNKNTVQIEKEAVKPSLIQLEQMAASEQLDELPNEYDLKPTIRPDIMIIEEVMVKQASYKETSPAAKPDWIRKERSAMNHSQIKEKMPWPNKPALAGTDRSPNLTREKVISKSKIFASQHFEELRTNFSENVNDEGKVFKLSQIYYVDGDYKITEQLATRLDQLVAIMKNNPSIDLEVRSHTESIGDDQQNLMLSELRAHTVRNYLIRKGIDEHRLAYRGYGESELINTCSNEVDCDPAQHRENQRVEIKILKE